MNKQTERLREKIARFCHDTDFTCGMAEKPYVAESWGIAPEEVKQSYYKEADQILKTCIEEGLKFVVPRETQFFIDKPYTLKEIDIE